MINHKLNAQVAEEVMGWKNVGPLQGGNVPFGERPDDYNEDHPTNPMIDQVPDYSGSLDAAWQMEEEIERRGRDCLCLYVRRVIWNCGGVGHPDSPQTLWRYIHATPEQRCEAALEAVREK